MTRATLGRHDLLLHLATPHDDQGIIPCDDLQFFFIQKKKLARTESVNFDPSVRTHLSVRVLNQTRYLGHNGAVVGWRAGVPAKTQNT